MPLPEPSPPPTDPSAPGSDSGDRPSFLFAPTDPFGSEVPLDDAVTRQRALEFLRAQSAILVVALIGVVGSNLTGIMGTVLAVQSVVFTAVVGVATAFAWWLLSTRLLRPDRVILGLLYADSLLGFAAFYVGGELETPATAICLLCVVMVPLYGGRRHALLMGLTQWLTYSGLIAARQWGWLEPYVSYGYMLPPEAVTDPAFVLDSWVAFTIACFGMTFVAGRASIDIVNSRAQLKAEVRSKTAALRDRTREVESARGELVVANRDLARTNRELALSNSRLEQFNAAVSHDLRTPLQHMVSRAELLALTGKSNPERIEPMADAIIESAERMAVQLDELLKLSRVGNRLPDLEPVPLGRAASLAIQDLSTELRVRRASLELINPLPTAMGNAALLQEMFQNLFQNGLKFGSAPYPRVRVASASAPPGYVAVSVEDDGEGVPREDRDRVFRLFQRGRRATSEEGVGAGLAIVRRIVEVHGGEIHIEQGRELGGARFVVTLRAGPEEAAQSDEGPATGPGPIAIA